MTALDATLEALDRALAGATPEVRRATLAGVLAWTAAQLVVTDGAQTRTTTGEEVLLDVPAAAERLKVAPDWIYRRAKCLPFVLRLGPRMLRCSSTRLDKYIRERAGK